MRDRALKLDTLGSGHRSMKEADDAVSLPESGAT